MATDYTAVIEQLYISYFGRPADAGGLMSFQAQLAALDPTGAITSVNALNTAVQAGTNPALNALVNSFNTSAESIALYGSVPATGASYTQVANFVNSIYENVLGRAADSAGGNFWIDAIQNHGLSLANAALAITQGAESNTSAQGLMDAKTVANKLATATDFTNSLTSSPTLTLAAGYAGDAAAAAGRAMLQGIDSTTSVTDQQAASQALDALVANGLAPTVFTLTTGIDGHGTGAFASAAPAGNAVINGVFGASASATTINPLDHIVATGLNNTFNIADQAGGTVGLNNITVTGVQTANVESVGTVSNDFSGWTGLTALNVISVNGDGITAAATTNVTVVDTATGTSGGTAVTGGNNVTVTVNGTGSHYDNVTVDGSAGAVTVNQNTVGEVNIGENAAVTGTVTVNDTNFNDTDVYVYTGTDVTINVTNAQGESYLQVGDGSAATNPTGTVTITETSVATSQTNTTVYASDDIEVYGGTVITVTEHAAASASAATGALQETSNQGSVYVYNEQASGMGTVTSVTVTQDAAVAGNAYTAAVAAVAPTTTATNIATAATVVGSAYTYEGLTFTAYTTVTNAQLAAAFANLTHGAYQGNSTLGTYSGQFAGIATGAVTTASGVSTVLETTAAGSDAVAATPGVQTVTNGEVGVEDASYASSAATATDTITTITAVNASEVYDYGTALQNLNTTNVTGEIWVGNEGTATLLNAVPTTLNLAVNGDAGYFIDNSSQYTTLNIITSGADSSLDTGEVSVIAGVKALTVSGTNAVDLTGATLTALQTVVVSGSAGLTIDASGATVKDVNTSATSGDNTITIDATKATYEGGSGADSVTVIGNVSKAISLGAGENTLTLSSTTAAISATVNGGSGTADTLAMDSGLAATDSGTTLFASAVTGFEHLTLTGSGTNSVDVSELGHFSYVTDASTGAVDSLTIENLGSAGTLVLTQTGFASTDTIDATVASTVANSLSIIVSTSGVADAANTVTTTDNANITSVAIAANDTDVHDKAGHITDTLTLTDAEATSITVTGNANLVLTSANTSVSTVDAHAMTGGLTYITAGVVAETVTGGAGNNVLTAGTGTTADTLNAGAGNDVLTSNAGLDTLNGGAGTDTFVINVSTNVNSYATINHAHVGDMISFGGLDTVGMVAFSQTQVALASTAVFQDYANAAVHATATAAGDVAWFQFGGNTYVVENNAGTETSFTNGTDSIVKLTGLVDLSHTSLSTQHNTLLIG